MVRFGWRLKGRNKGRIAKRREASGLLPPVTSLSPLPNRARDRLPLARRHGMGSQGEAGPIGVTSNVQGAGQQAAAVALAGEAISLGLRGSRGMGGSARMEDDGGEDEYESRDEEDEGEEEEEELQRGVSIAKRRKLQEEEKDDEEEEESEEGSEEASEEDSEEESDVESDEDEEDIVEVEPESGVAKRRKLHAPGVAQCRGGDSTLRPAQTAVPVAGVGQPSQRQGPALASASPLRGATAGESTGRGAGAAQAEGQGHSPQGEPPKGKGGKPGGGGGGASTCTGGGGASCITPEWAKTADSPVQHLFLSALERQTEERLQRLTLLHKAKLARGVLLRQKESEDLLLFSRKYAEEELAEYSRDFVKSHVQNFCLELTRAAYREEGARSSVGGVGGGG